jgi:hypothetical protein
VLWLRFVLRETPTLTPLSVTVVGYSPKCPHLEVFLEVRKLGSAMVHQRHTEKRDSPTDYRQHGRNLAQPQVGDYHGNRGEEVL